MLVSHYLEYQTREGRFRIRRALFFLTTLRIHTSNRHYIERTWEEIDYRVEKRLNALVLKGRARTHRNDLERDRLTSQGGANLLVCNLLSREILFRDLIICIGKRFDHFLAGSFSIGAKLLGYLDDDRFGSLVLDVI